MLLHFIFILSHVLSRKFTTSHLHSNFKIISTIVGAEDFKPFLGSFSANSQLLLALTILKPYHTMKNFIIFVCYFAVSLPTVFARNSLTYWVDPSCRDRGRQNTFDRAIEDAKNLARRGFDRLQNPQDANQKDVFSKMFKVASDAQPARTFVNCQLHSQRGVPDLMLTFHSHFGRYSSKWGRNRRV